MRAIEEFGELLGRKINQNAQVQTAYAICKTVDWEARTMTATGQTDGLDYYNVRLGLGAGYKRPKVGTLCLLGLVENQGANAFLIAGAELEEIYLITNTTEVQVKEAGIHIKRGGQDLLSIMNDMIDEINKIKVIYGNTIDVASMLAIKARLNEVLI